MAIINPLKGLYNEFVKITQGIEIKYSNKAEAEETLEKSQYGDEYVTAKLGKDTFESYVDYERDLLMSAGITDQSLIDQCLLNRDNIPILYRDRLFKMKRNRVLLTYEERNTYYRTMTGVPNKSDDDYVYAEGFEEYDISPSIPIHLLDQMSISILRDLGYIDKIIAKYPQKEYLRYLGDKAIPVEVSRPAKNFSLIRTPTTAEVNDTILSEFKLIYEQCREYFVSVIYIPEYNQIYSFYDNFIALCIMVMTIQQMIVRSMKMTVDRDFFDEYCINLLFEMYRIPSIPGIELADKKSIAQNLNMLIQNKATDKVLYDIANILGFTDVGIYKYLIVKQQKFDVNGNPIHVEVEEGREKTIEEYSQEFDLYFQKLEVKDRDAYQALQVSRNRESYNEITDDDPFWYDDEVKQILYESEYNYAESKYLSVNVSFKLSEVMFECIYFINMCLDKKNEMHKVQVSLPKILGNTTVSIFDAVVACCTLLSKKHGLCGEIVHESSDILFVNGFDFESGIDSIKDDISTQRALSETKTPVAEFKRKVLGFNFDADFDEIREEIISNRFLNSNLVEYISNLQVYNAESINRLYKNVYNLRDELTNAMAAATDIRAYQAYKKLYQTLFLKEATNKIFAIGTDENGEPKFASTYRDYLRYINPELYTALDEAVGLSGDMESPFSPWNEKREFSNPDSAWNGNKDKATGYISHILARLNAVVEDLRNLYNLNDVTGGSINALITLIRFFKSYTTDMIGLNVVYLFNTRALNMMKLLDHIAYIHKEELWRDNSLKLTHSDVVSRIISRMNENDTFQIHDQMLSFISFAIGGDDGFSLDDWMDYKIIIQRRDGLSKTRRHKTVLADMMIIPYKHRENNEELKIEDAMHFVVDMSYSDEMMLSDRYVRDFLKEHRNDPGFKFDDEVVSNFTRRYDCDETILQDTAHKLITKVPLNDVDALRVSDKIKSINLI